MITIATASVARIRTEEDHEAALERVSELMDVLSSPNGQIEDPDHPARIELDSLVDLIQLYEQRHYPIGPLSAVDTIRVVMEERELEPEDLASIIGSRAEASEVLSGRRKITAPMAHALHKALRIQMSTLLRDPATLDHDPLSGMNPREFPLKTMAKRGWILDVPESEIEYYAEELLRILVNRADADDPYTDWFHADACNSRLSADLDQRAFAAWRWQVLALARELRLEAFYNPGTVTPDFLRRVAKLSASENGPLLAEKLLAEHGIPLIILPHLPGAPLDGATLRSADRRPVIGLTIRGNRADEFWFCLLRELAHVALHIDADGDALIEADGDIFIHHDHSLRRG